MAVRTLLLSQMRRQLKHAKARYPTPRGVEGWSWDMYLGSYVAKREWGRLYWHIIEIEG